VTDKGLRQRAPEFGVTIRAEDGIARAVEIIGEMEKQQRKVAFDD